MAVYSDYYDPLRKQGLIWINSENPDKYFLTKEEAEAYSPSSKDTNVNKLTEQILSQGTTGKWTGQGYGGPEANARAIAKMLDSAGIQDIREFGKVYKSQYQEIKVNPVDAQKENLIFETPGQYYKGTDPKSSSPVYFSENQVTKTKDGFVVKDYPALQDEYWGNTRTGERVTTDYNKAGGNIFGGTYTGHGHTAFGVELAPNGTPYFYTAFGGDTSSVGQIAPILGLGLSLLAPGIGTAIGTALGATGTAAAMLGNAVLQGTLAEATGGDFTEGAIRGAATGAAQGFLGGQTMAAGGGPSELASVGETGYGLTGPIDVSGGISDNLIGGVASSAANTLLPPVDYSLAQSTTVPGMGAGGVKVDLPPLPEPSAIGTQPIDYSLTGQTMPGILGGIGLQTPTMPNIGTMGGAQGLTVPVEGGTVGQLGATSAGATPSLGDPSSFINQPDVLGQPVIQQGTPAGLNISVQDALRGARALGGLLNQPQQQPSGMPSGDQGALAQQGGVDYTSLLNLLAQRPQALGLLGTRYQPQPINIASLLG